MLLLDELVAASAALTQGLARASLQSLALAALAGLGLWVCRVKAPALRHGVWCLAAAVMLVSPWADLRPARAAIEAPFGEASYLSIVADAADTLAYAGDPATLTPWSLWLAGVWLLGFLACAARWGSGALWLRGVIRAATPIGLAPAGSLLWLESAQVRAPLAAGWLRPSVLVPSGWRQWSEARKQSVIAHETAHFRRGDLWFLALAGLNRAVFWFHPLAWRLESRIAAEAELACDDEVRWPSATGGNTPGPWWRWPPAPASQPGRFVPGAVAMAGAARVAQRVDRLLAAGAIRRGILRKGQWAALSTSILAAFALTLQVAPILAQAPGIPVMRLMTRPASAPPGEIGFESWIVEDPSANEIADADVSLLDETTGETVFRTTSGPEGNFRVSAAPGRYRLLVRSPCCEPKSQNVTLGPGTRLQFGPSTDASSAGAGPPEMPKRIPLSGTMAESRLIRRVEPVYPADALQEGAAGTVTLRVIIGRDGAPVEIEPETGEVDARLVEAAVQAVRQWRYKPTLLNGQAVEVATQVQIIFAP